MKYLDQIKADIQKKFELARNHQPPEPKVITEEEQKAQTARQADVLIKAALAKAAGR